MALYKMTDNEISAVSETTFADLGIKERADLQRLLSRNIRVIAEETEGELLVISEEFGNWENAKRRIDLLAVDKDANLVVIELKRDAEGAHMELQAVRYAAMIARMTFEQALEAYGKFLVSIGSQVDPLAELLKFLDWAEPNAEAFGGDVRIVLVAADFSQEITSTVLWLNERDLDIRCVRLAPYKLDDHVILDVEQVIPLPLAEKYQTQIRQKKQEEREAIRTQRGERVLDTLVAQGALKPGARLHLVNPPRPGPNILDEKAKHATFENTGKNGIKWDFDGSNYSISPLCKKICELSGGNVGKGAFRGPDHWALEGQKVSLTELAAGGPSAQPADLTGTT